MSEKIITGVSGDITNYFGVQRETGTNKVQHFRGMKQDITPIIKRHQAITQAQEAAPKGARTRQYIGSIPMSFLVDWLTANHYTWDQYARNVDGAKDKFKKHFFSREFAKLHNQHITTCPTK